MPRGYPLCVEGARTGPPEDVGGVHGFAQYLEAIANPRHMRHKELLAWSGPFNPEAFDAKAVTRRMRQGFPEPRPEDYI
ncbi:MAG: plasmid pRiA4b ORF-3 family protein [Pirellulaceae bacterium]|nr:plasmid pRiA4b ORF-3 family protein [Pirellulaceae bacterium]